MKPCVWWQRHLENCHGEEPSWFCLIFWSLAGLTVASNQLLPDRSSPFPIAWLTSTWHGAGTYCFLRITFPTNRAYKFVQNATLETWPFRSLAFVLSLVSWLIALTKGLPYQCRWAGRNANAGRDLQEQTGKDIIWQMSNMVSSRDAAGSSGVVPCIEWVLCWGSRLPPAPTMQCWCTQTILSKQTTAGMHHSGILLN